MGYDKQSRRIHMMSLSLANPGAEIRALEELDYLKVALKYK